MSIRTFQLGCLLVLAVAYAFSLRATGDRRRRALEVAALAVAAWCGEETCITIYGAYTYANGWAFPPRGDVPWLVPLIWPLVILSAREVDEALFDRRAPGSRASSGTFGRAIRVGAIVAFDASLMEVVSVAAGFWRWWEPGYLGVPLVGVLGWGCFAVGASLGLDLAKGGPAWRLLALPLLALASTHVLLQVLWRGALAHGLRGDLGPRAWLAFGVVGALACVPVLRVRPARRLPLGTTLPRLAASSVFFALLVTLGGPADVPGLYAHTAAVGLPYVLAVGWGGGRRGEH